MVAHTEASWEKHKCLRCCQCEQPPVRLWLKLGCWHSRTFKRMLRGFRACVWPGIGQGPQGGSPATESRGGMYEEWSRGRKQNKDRCQRAVVIPELIHWAGRSIPDSTERKTGWEVMCRRWTFWETVCVKRGSRGWRGNVGMVWKQRTRAGHRKLWSLLSSSQGSVVLFMAPEAVGSPPCRAL